MSSPASSTSAVKQPEWRVPTNSAPASPLRILNSLTRTKTEVVPRQGKRLTWYNCGPTVYDASHLGHARTYLTVDILRRILTDYFHFDVFFVMNITDIDDKIILRSRQAHLLQDWKHKHVESGEVDAALKQALEAYNVFIKDKLGDKASSALLSSIVADPKAFPPLPFTPVDASGPVDPVDEGKWVMYVTAARKAYETITTLASSTAPAEDRMNQLTQGAGDVIAPWLDAQLASTVSHPKIFKAHAAYWERDFLQDMEALRVRPADIVTRVSEYIPEIVQFVEKIIERGYAYEADGSVYFNVAAFKASPRHDYAKLEPWSAGSANLLEEGEGSLGSKLRGKRAAADFALWKQSKDGEPSWPSPWGPGRPGWHIECSAMASEILGETMDIHSGGIDLAFPHHDNELAQSEAYHECDQWVNYFIHPGHLHIEGQKMSKSLKNFITIKEALAKYTARQLRLTFLLHPWESRLDFRESGMEEAKGVEGTLKKFFLNVRSTLSELKAKEQEASGEEKESTHGYTDRERALVAQLATSQLAVHEALADSIDTPTALRHLLDLVSRVNVYMLEAARDTGVHGDVVAKVAAYITRMMQVFGLTDGRVIETIGFGQGVEDGSGEGTSVGKEEVILPYARLISQFRDRVRALARSSTDSAAAGGKILSLELLKLCDQLRDVELADLGVLLDDREDGAALVKLVDPEEIRKEREEKARKEEEKARKKAAAAAAAQAKKTERLAKGKVAPEELFRTEEAKATWSEWDEQGIPTKDAQGEEVGKSRRKKLIKEWEAQKKLHAEWKASTTS